MEAPSFSSFEFDTKTSLQEQLQRQLSRWISSGRLPSGTRLPSSRRLSSELKISRNTITIVLDQLKSEGFLESIQGKGVYVASDIPSDSGSVSSINWVKKGALPELSGFGLSLNTSPLVEHGKILPFTPGIPDLESFPQKAWLSIQRRHQDRTCLMGYDGNQGYGPLRESLAEYLKLSRGVRCKPEQIIVTQGAQQAISLCTQLLLNEGDAVLVENPGYMGARKAFLARRSTLISCPMSEHGVDVTALQHHKKINALKPKLMYVTPTHQYPLGGILPASDRLKLLDWAVQNDTWIIEDDYDSEFHYFHKPIAALQGMSDQTPIIYTGSFSKTLFPALRLGYLVVPEALVKVFVKAKSFMGGESPLLTQAVVADFINEGHFVRHLRKMRLLYQSKWQHLNSLINQQLSGYATPILQSAGMHLAIKIPTIDDEVLKQQFFERGFGSSALSSYFNEQPSITGLVLGFANTNEHQRINGVSSLKELIKSQAH